jgi:hypothetical protein
MRTLTLYPITALATVAAASFFFVACGSDGDSSPVDDVGDSSTASADASTGPTQDAATSSDASSAPKSFTLSASVVGLAGTGLVLTDAKGGDVIVAPAGGSTQKVTFPVKLAAGATYDVTVKAQPSGPPQRCEVSGGKGTVVSGDVTGITVNCTTLFTVGGTVSGLAGKDLVLENNGTADSVTINANGQFAFPKPLAPGAAWAVTVKQNPTAKWQTCTVSVGDGGAASGTVAAANVTNVDVKCTTNSYDLSVKVAGVSGTGLVFQNKAANDLPAPTPGTYAFASKVASGDEYDVTVLTQPQSPSQTCTVTNGKANMAGANVVLDATCTVNTYKVGGTLAGLQGNGLVLQDNAGDDLVLDANKNGAFSFATKVASGQPYVVTVKTQPNGVAGETCAVTAGSGTVVDADIASVSVTCDVSKRVFVTSQLYTTNIGGLDGGDAKCQALATAAGLPGTYRAWLSDTTGSPSTRFAQSTIPYKLVDGTVIATNWGDLTDGTLAHVIDKDEKGAAPPVSGAACASGVSVMTNTNANGTQFGAANSCGNWLGVGNQQIVWGRYSATNTEWAGYCTGYGFCGNDAYKYPLYCFQQ